MVTSCFMVMPCLNEELNLQKTCASLGFGIPGTQPQGIDLVIVDNGSTDDTVGIASQIKDTCSAGTVHVIHESVRGFVPARSAGVEFVDQYVRNRGLRQSECLILQVDADAEYSSDYPHRFVESASAMGLGNIFEAESIIPSGISEEESDLLYRLDTFDKRFFENEVCGEDFVIDDKMVGYFLSDWHLSGGLQREFLDGREYIFCGSSRMWIRMQRKGFKRKMVSGAACAHSIRKLSEDGADIFSASAGWPRSSGWKERWRSEAGRVPTAGHLLEPRRHSLWNSVLAERERHLAAMFVHLPIVLAENARAAVNITPLRALVSAFEHSGIDLTEDFRP